MKLRVRSATGGDTYRVELSSPFSLQSLKDAIAQKLSTSSSSIHLSLNKKDEIQGPPHTLLKYIGITGGDLVFYKLHPDGFSNFPITVSGNTQAIERERDYEQTVISRRELCASAAMKRASASTSTSTPDGVDSNTRQSREMAVSAPEESHHRQPEVEVEDESMEVDEESIMPAKSRSIPCFLERVLFEEYLNAKGSHGLLIIAVHAVMLESGFVCFDMHTDEARNGFRLPEGWGTKGTVSLYYTLPELVNKGGIYVENVVLKTQTLGKFLVVYGSLANGKGSQVYRLSLEVSKFLPAVQYALHSLEMTGNGGNSSNALGIDQNGENDFPKTVGSQLEKDVFELWKFVKDRLSLPVLTALCEKAGLPSPPSLVLLPTELKLKVLEFLPAVDIAKVGCVCRELQFFSANDELWKQKFIEEVGSAPHMGRAPGAGRWKDAFARVWIDKKKMARRSRTIDRAFWPVSPLMRRFPSPLAGPGFGITGGDYDRFPAIGGGMFRGGPLGGFGGRFELPGRRSMVPDCVLGELTGEFGGRSGAGYKNLFPSDLRFREE
eukprot:Gb_01642 [translate_table: standard]